MKIVATQILKETIPPKNGYCTYLVNFTSFNNTVSSFNWFRSFSFFNLVAKANRDVCKIENMGFYECSHLHNHLQNEIFSSFTKRTNKDHSLKSRRSFLVSEI